MTRWLSIFVVAGLGTTALPEPSRAADETAAPRNYWNLRIGGASTGIQGRVVLCGEGAPTRWLSIEACGNGSEVLGVAESEPALSHYLVKLRLWSLRTGRGWLQPHAGVGFTELQVGPDELGFNFTSAGRQGESTAGPEGSLSLRGLYPLSPRWELIVDMRLSMAYLPHAGELSKPMGRYQSSAGLSVGVGF